MKILPRSIIARQTQLATTVIYFLQLILPLLVESLQSLKNLCPIKPSDGLNNVRSLMFNSSKPNIGCSRSITNSSTCLSCNDVRVRSISNLLNLVEILLGLKFNHSKPMFEFDRQQMNTFKFVGCLKNDVRVCSMFNKMVFDPSLEISQNQTTVEEVIISLLLQRRIVINQAGGLEATFATVN